MNSRERADKEERGVKKERVVGGREDLNLRERR
jgi:hypothetical protein